VIKLYGVFRYEGQFIDTLEVFNVDKYEFNIKLEQIKKLKKDSLITEDEQRKAEDDAQKITDKAIKDIDGICAAKEKEIMEV